MFKVMPIKEHYEIKDQLLEIIERQNTTPTKFEREQVSRTDWHVDRAQIREYFKFIFLAVFQPFIQSHAPLFGSYFNISALGC